MEFAIKIANPTVKLTVSTSGAIPHKIMVWLVYVQMVDARPLLQLHCLGTKLKFGVLH